jgi:hypothetical protein
MAVLSGTLFIPREQSIVRQLQEIVGEADQRRSLGRARRALEVTDETAGPLLDAAEALRPLVDRQRAGIELGELAVQPGQAAPDRVALADAGVRAARRQVLLLVQDLLRRAIARASGSALTALAERRAAVSAALAEGLDDEPAVMDAVGRAYDVLTAEVPTITRRVVASEAPSPPAEMLLDDLADLERLVAAATAAPPGPDGDTDPRWRGLRALDVLLTATSSTLAPDPQRIDLVQLSANAPNCFDGRSTAEAKLTGVQLDHFGAFYRGGWRANDWMWGRLDGAFRLVEMLVDPDALLATGRPVPELAAELAALATGPSPGPDHDWLAAQPVMVGAAARIEELLTAAATPDAPDRAAAVTRARREIARMVAARVQLEVLRDEVLHVRTLVAADRESGAAATPHDTLFLEACRQLDRSSPTATLVEAFRSCLVGQDRLDAELGSDRMTALGTQALAVAAGAAGTVTRSRKAVAVLRPVLALARGTFRAANALTTPGFRGSQLVQVVLPTLAVLAAAVLALAIAEDRSTTVQIVLAVLLAGLALVAILASIGRTVLLVGAIILAALLVDGALLAGSSWRTGPFAGATLAVLSAAGLSWIVLRRRGPRGAPAPSPSGPTPGRGSGGDRDRPAGR